MLRESQIETQLVKRVRECGGDTRKVKWIGRTGAPDRFVMLPTKSVWVELKYPGVKCKPHQLREHARMRGYLQTVLVIDSFELIEELVA